MERRSLMKKILIIITISLFNSCCPLNGTPQVKITSFPKKPLFTHVGEKPIIEQQKTNFLVTPEFIKRSSEQLIYLKAILIWREKNNIKE